MRDRTGIESATGSVFGAEARLQRRNLLPGERTRGWVWFELPAAATIVELVDVAPGPQFRVPVPIGGR